MRGLTKEEAKLYDEFMDREFESTGIQIYDLREGAKMEFQIENAIIEYVNTGTLEDPEENKFFRFEIYFEVKIGEFEIYDNCSLELKDDFTFSEIENAIEELIKDRIECGVYSEK